MGTVSFKHRLEYFALLFVAAIVRRLPRKAALNFGKIMGRLTMKVLQGRYRLARENMSKALPELSQKEIDEGVRKNFEHIGISGVEMLRLDMFESGSDDIHHFFEITNLSLLDHALDLNKGVILLTGHLGFWEVGQFILPELGIPFDVVAKPLKNPLVDKYFAGIRTSFGAQIINSRKGARRIVKSLRAGHAVGILLDQHISPPGSAVTEFFGRKAYTTTAITSLAIKHQIPIVPVFCLRQPDNRYKVQFEPMLMLNGDGDNAVAQGTQHLTEIIESAVRKDITQWFWMHKRWRVKTDNVKGKKSE